MTRMNWEKLLSTKRVEDYGPCATSPRRDSQFTDPRSPFEKDCDQLIFSYPFRRLQDKTQVIPFPEYDFVHTRLTHSLEVASVGRSFGKIVYPLIQSEIQDYLKSTNITASDIGALVAAACYAHDIGNPPFGHSGEASISLYFTLTREMMPHFIQGKNYREEGETMFYDLYGYHKTQVSLSEFIEHHKLWNDLSMFEGNANGFRIITKSCEKGINPTSALLGAFTKYPRESYLHNDPFQDIPKPKSQSKYGFFQSEKDLFKDVADELGLIPFEGIHDRDIAYHRHPLAFLMEASDDIAYGMIDFEDGCRLGIIDFDKTYTTLSIRDKITNKNEERVINMSPKEILIEIAKTDTSFDPSKLNGLKDFKEVIAYLRSKVINVLIHDCVSVFYAQYEAIMRGQYDKSLIEDIHPDSYAKWKKMKWLVQKYVYNYPSVLQVEASGFEVIHHLIQSLGIASGVCYSCKEIPNAKQIKLTSLLPEEYLINEELEGEITYRDKYNRMLSVLDYISGMTDNYAISLYRKIKGIALQTR